MQKMDVCDFKSLFISSLGNPGRYFTTSQPVFDGELLKKKTLYSNSGFIAGFD